MKFLSRSTNKPFHVCLSVALAGVAGSGKLRLMSGLQLALPACGQVPAIHLLDTPSAVAASRDSDFTFLMGLDPGRPAASSDADRLLRDALQARKMPYQVLYGTPEERLAQAVYAVRGHAGEPSHTANAVTNTSTRPWRWVCDKCSDPQCEHRLLSELLSARALTAL